jgi:hypothetical protein
VAHARSAEKHGLPPFATANATPSTRIVKAHSLRAIRREREVYGKALAKLPTIAPAGVVFGSRKYV